MNVIPWLVAGGLAGWAAGRLMQAPGGAPVYVALGVVGAFLGGWLLGPMMGTGPIDQSDFGLASLAVSLLGALVMLILAATAQRAAGR